MTKLFLSFDRKDKLLLAGFEETNFYILLSKNKNELDEWIQMATDF